MENFFISKNFIQISWIFSCNECILVIVRLWVKLFVSQGWIQTEIAMHTL